VLVMAARQASVAEPGTKNLIARRPALPPATAGGPAGGTARRRLGGRGVRWLRGRTPPDGIEPPL